jgi:hypothetical protein
MKIERNTPCTAWEINTRWQILETVQHANDGLITKSEMADKIEALFTEPFPTEVG